VILCGRNGRPLKSRAWYPRRRASGNAAALYSAVVSIVASLCLLLAAADAGAPEPPREAWRELELRPAPVRLLDGTFQLRLNTGWFATRPAARDPAAEDAGAKPPAAFAGGFDLAQRRGRLSLGGGDDRRLLLRIEWDVALDNDMARVQSRIDLGLLGQTFRLAPPDVRVRPTFDHGEPGFELNVPLVEGRF
jgi:hypothetical protein